VLTNYRRSYSWTVAYKMPPAWPAYVEFIHGPQSPPDEQGGAWFYEILSNEDIAQPGGTVFFEPRGELPEGQALVVAAVLADVLPLGYEVPRPVMRGGTNRGLSLSAEQAWQSVGFELRTEHGPETLHGAERWRPSDDFVWATRYRGYSWLDHLRGGPKPERPRGPDLLPVQINENTPGVTAVPVTRDQATKVRVEIPEDLEEKIRTLVDSTTDADKLQGSFSPLSPPFFTAAKITVAGSRPLTAADEPQTPGESAQ